ncbi:hypothetical protein OPQ81_001073 [Rhizoctonia solani]|nr:hypothetical protein OPQ81_001073 [Rhizoctonia solani]
MLGCGSVNAESIELLREMTVLYFDLRILYEPAYTACSSSACQPAYILSLGQPMHQDVDRENPLNQRYPRISYGDLTPTFDAKLTSTCLGVNDARGFTTPELYLTGR